MSDGNAMLSQLSLEVHVTVKLHAANVKTIVVCVAIGDSNESIWIVELFSYVRRGIIEWDVPRAHPDKRNYFHPLIPQLSIDRVGCRTWSSAMNSATESLKS